jgi:hypothetical protein
MTEASRCNLHHPRTNYPATAYDPAFLALQDLGAGFTAHCSPALLPTRETRANTVEAVTTVTGPLPLS